MRADLWEDSALERVRKCGRVSMLPAGGAVVRGGRRPGSGASAGLAGLCTCGSVWADPVCAARVAARRAENADRAFTALMAKGHALVLGTFTMRHRSGQSVEACRDAAAAAWSRMTGGGRWMKIQNKQKINKKDGLGNKHLVDNPKYDPHLPTVLEWLRSLEATFGDNGPHVHFHSVFVLDEPCSDAMVRELGEAMWVDWEKGLASQGFDAVRDQADGRSLGLDMRVLNDPGEFGEYLTKAMAWELSNGLGKKGRKGGRTPFELYDYHRQTGDAAALQLYNEYERAFRDRRQQTSSRGFWELAGIKKVETDDEIAAEEGGGGEDLLQLPAPTWWAICRVAWQLLDVVEAEGLAGAERWLRVRGLAYGVITLPGVAPP